MKPVAKFEIFHQQLLTPEGKPTGDWPAFARDTDELLRMYRFMTGTRTFDTKAINLQRTGKLGTYASSLGHEAAHVGIGSAMRHEDALAPMYREYGAQFYRGVQMADVLRYWGGDERGNDFSGPAHDFAWCVPIATQCLHAAGAAMAFKLRREKRCAVAIIGDGGTSEGAFYEALNAAGAGKLPVVFVVVNNKWAISVPIELQTAAKTLAQKGIAAGIECAQVDGNDVIAVRAAVEIALERGRNGDGPTLIEAVTYRLSDHTTADDASRYRPKEQVEEAWKNEPLIRIRAYLKSIGVWDDDKEKTLLEECAAIVDTAVEEYRNTPDAGAEFMFEHMYASWPESLDYQIENAKKYFAPGGGSH